MNTGQIISGAGHFGLIAFALFGGAFKSEPLPFEVTEVTAISAEEFALLQSQTFSPDAVANVDTPEPPNAGEAAPEISSEPDDAPEVAQPEITETPPPDEVPDTPVAPPQTEVDDQVAVLQPPVDEEPSLLPETPEPSQPQPSDRVAPEPIAQPEPDVQIDTVDQQATAPDDSPDPVEEQQDETAQDAASDRIVTEAEALANAAPSSSVRPRARPNRPTPEPETETTDSAAIDEAVAAATAAAANAGETSQGAPSGPPLTAGEKDGLRVAVQECWNVGSLSTDALNTSVEVGFTMTEDAKPIADSIRMISASGGNNSSAQHAYAAARRAIIRCGSKGFNLPEEKYGRWRETIITFNPEKMRIK